MKKLLKYLRPFAGAIIVAIMLLFVQAISDLSLPSYMSNIVNIGIQQKGIEDAVPKAIKSSEFNKLLLFINNDEKKLLQDNMDRLEYVAQALLVHETLDADQFIKAFNKELSLESEVETATTQEETEKDNDLNSEVKENKLNLTKEITDEKDQNDDQIND